MSKIKIGILAVQGDVTENFLATMASMSELGIDGSVIQVKTVEQISTLDGLIIPGGESTVIGQMSLVNGAIKKIKEKIESGMPVFGICAGMVFLSKNSQDRIVGNVDQPLLDILDVKIERNSFGRQKDSFEAKISMEPIGISSFHGVFGRSKCRCRSYGRRCFGSHGKNTRVCGICQGYLPPVAPCAQGLRITEISSARCDLHARKFENTL